MSPAGLPPARPHPSPNHDSRGGATPLLIVLHYTAMTSAAEALARLSDPAHEVSCHYLIDRDGTLWQLVDEGRRAWHAGMGSWQGEAGVNARSLGIELVNDGAEPFAEPQMRVLEALLAVLMARWKIGPEGVIGHADMAPTRKADPGRRFDWRRLARQGLAVWPQSPAAPTPPPDEARFLALAARFGYPAEAGTPAVLEAFRQRFRPWARGPLAPADMAAIAALARRWGTPTA